MFIYFFPTNRHSWDIAKKVGLFCSLICTNYQDQSCSNVESNTRDEDSCDIKTTDAPFFLEQFTEIQQKVEEESDDEDITVKVAFEYYQSD